MRRRELDGDWGRSNPFASLFAPSAYSMNDTSNWLGQFRFSDFGSPFDDWQLTSSSRLHHQSQDAGGSWSMSPARRLHKDVMQHFQSSRMPEFIMTKYFRGRSEYMMSLLMRTLRMLNIESRIPDWLPKPDRQVSIILQYDLMSWRTAANKRTEYMAPT